MARRLLAYFLLDTSGSMNGEPIQALNNAFHGLITMLRTDPQAIDSLYISVVTFDREVKNLIPLTDLASYQDVEITCPPSGPTHTGGGLEMVYHLASQEVIKTSPDHKGDWKPLLFVFTDGKPSDLQKYREWVPKIQDFGFSVIVGCAAGPKAEESFLKELTDDVVKLDTTDSTTLSSFFRWVSTSIELGSRTQGTAEYLTLPPPPDELHVVV